MYVNKDIRKITILLPNKLIGDALKATGENLTSTLKKGLKLVAAKEIYKKLSLLHGSYKQVNFDLSVSRTDRKFK